MLTCDYQINFWKNENGSNDLLFMFFPKDNLFNDRLCPVLMEEPDVAAYKNIFAKTTWDYKSVLRL